MTIEIRTHGSSNIPEVVAELNTLGPRLDRAMIAGGEDGIDAIHDAAYAAIRKRTGRTAQDIKKQVIITGPGSGEGEVYITNPVGSYLYHGTGLHGPQRRRIEIKPRGQALKVPGSRRGYAARVSHPGIRGDEWLRVGAEAAEPRVKAAFERHVDRAFGV